MTPTGFTQNSLCDVGIRARIMAAQYASAGEISERLNIPLDYATAIVAGYAEHRKKLGEWMAK